MGQSSPRSFRRIFIILLPFTLVITGLRIWVASNLGLAPDEAYYWTWSLSPSLAYPDHPPMVAWLIKLGTGIFGHTELGVRASSVAIGALSVPVLYLAASRCKLSPQWSLWFVVVASLLPMVSTGALLATPDPFLAFALLISLVVLLREPSKGTASRWYIIAAITCVALWAKHSALLLPIIAVVACFFSTSGRRSFGTLHPWLAGVAVILSLTAQIVIDTNGSSGSILHQLNHLWGTLPGRLETPLYLAPVRILELLSGQVGLLTPLVAFYFFRGLQKQRPFDRTIFTCAACALVPLFAAGITAITTHPEQNWASLTHPAFALVAALYLSKRPASRVLEPRVIVLSVTVIAITATIHVHALTPILPLPPERDPVSRMHGWELLPSSLPKEEVDAILCDNYGLASQLRWQTRNTTDFSPVASSDRPGAEMKGTFLILDEQGDWGKAAPEYNCKTHESRQPITLKRSDGETVRKIDVSIGYDCNSL